MKTLDNKCAADGKAAATDTKLFGNVDMWRLVCKASSEAEGWMKSTKAVDTGNGVLVQVSTQQGEHVAEAVTFVPGARLVRAGAQDGRLLYKIWAPLWARLRRRILG
jgi:hypothetical protein